MNKAIPYTVAIIVTMLWSSSFVLIKLGLKEVPPLYFATLRYALGFAILAVIDIASSRGHSRSYSGALNGAQKPRTAWATLIVAGISGFTVAQGLEYVGLFYLPAVTTSFILTFTPLFVLFIGILMFSERPSGLQMGGFVLSLIGAYAFFSTRISWQGQWLGLVIVLMSGIGWAVYVIAIRELQKTNRQSSLRVTTISMEAGVVGLVVLSAATGEYAPLTPNLILIVVWLSVVNTALAFFMWNWALKAIAAFELTVIQNIMLIEIAFFRSSFFRRRLRLSW
ncbi:MAG: EamA family transporter [Nitrososphaerota archaeon]|nr:EamA family transporter [Nitrososphaerota archaeon]MDG7039588.1 EamA family transporter [Nitrososphaerota archaeon]MDG7043289.1 EamA family transporter [Nitrososphaerota archaeon]MDG7046306.1 EamA family transporter [Nitrososphaerota archaeon]